MSWLTVGVGEWFGPFYVTRQSGERWHAVCKDKPGVYRLVGMKPIGSEGACLLDRVCGKDDTGTIYIGKAKSLQGRLAALVMTHDPSYATKKHKPFPERMAIAFPPENLAIWFSYTETETEAFNEEVKLLASYKSAFGEPPPMNSHG